MTEIKMELITSIGTATRTASSPTWTARSTSTPGPMPPCAGRCWSGPAPTRWAPTATRIPISGALATTPTIPPPAPSGASACARASLPWSPTSTCWLRRWVSPPGRSATATPSSRARCCPTGRSPTALRH